MDMTVKAVTEMTDKATSNIIILMLLYSFWFVASFDIFHKVPFLETPHSNRKKKM